MHETLSTRQYQPECCAPSSGSVYVLYKVWMISGGEIVNIYKRICRERSDVG